MRKNYILLLFGLLLLTVLFVASPVYADVDSEGWPTWAQVSSEKDGIYIVNDKSASGATMAKLKELCSYFYKDDGYYIEVAYANGHMDLLFYSPDDTALDLMNNGYELVVLPVSPVNDNFLFSFRLVKDGEVAFATGSNYEVRTNIDLNNYIVQKINSCNISYNPDVDYSCSVKLYMGDYSEYSPSVEAVRNAIFEGEVPPLNEADFLPKRYGVLEVPQNISYEGTGTYGFGINKEQFSSADDIKITWKQTDPNYKLWSTEVLIYGDMGVKWLYEVFGNFDRVDDLFLYSDEFSTSKLSFTVDMKKMIFKNPIWLNKVYDILDSDSGLYSDKCYGFSLMIRNKYFDGEYTYYSNWVELSFDDEGMHGGVSNEEAGSNIEYVYDDPVKGDEGTDFTQNKPTGAVNPDSPYQGDKINPSTDFSISDFLNNGFGLAGDGGLVDMFRELFSFIPAPVWTLILTGLSILIAIALLKAVF